ncbi:small secreted protein [Xylariaceae sp. FL0255]|nr:small secreted protein [Xylariaceae sp. FL0255]
MRFTIALIAASAAFTHGAAVFTQQTYNELSISGGVAGNALAEANDKFSALDQNDLANVDQADIDFLGSVNSIANDAEDQAFDPAIDAASGADADALQVGKIKNKVLKLQAQVLKLQIQQSQGEDVADDLATEQTKLNTDVTTDEASAGATSQAVDFDATTSSD